jgi:hypothetical protein
MKFVPILKNTKLTHCSEEFCCKVIDFYKWLNNTIDTLVKEEKWSLIMDFKKFRIPKTNQLQNTELPNQNQRTVAPILPPFDI